MLLFKILILLHQALVGHKFLFGVQKDFSSLSDKEGSAAVSGVPSLFPGVVVWRNGPCSWSRCCQNVTVDGKTSTAPARDVHSDLLATASSAAQSDNPECR